ncbi:glycoside hydrolase family 43 protein [Hyaloscypha variabilis F]|uniref:Glycoside hydrolase family 43 protein n=1 Tax=Hyaloscypha variabilis (strain UAMH 11265 / GT02V1 / F) TaxID=1149755 RepID=A0A2J6SAI2_HYAVF|nr:glycoside hydrolase family 43 protein [Hyaloscypha variabilis F]
MLEMPFTANTYLNPIIPGFNPDPSIVRCGDDYFLATSTFEYFPGVPIYHSKDLISWSLIGHALTRPNQLNLSSQAPSTGVFAPTLRYVKGRFYMATSVIRHAQDSEGILGVPVEPRGFYVWTDNIWDESSWSDPVYFDNLGIDQDLFFDDDGRVYLSTSASVPEEMRTSHGMNIGIYISEIDLDTGRSLNYPQIIRTSETEISIAEGSHILKKDGFYYLMTAEGGTESDHQEWICRSTTGPYATGHADLVEDKHGNWWAVLLALGRETFLCPVTWENGWPVFNGRQKISTIGKGPGLYTKVQETAWEETFPGKDISLGWYHRCTPIKKIYSVENSDTVRLYGGPYTLRDAETMSALLRKQISFNATWMATLGFSPRQVYEEAGIVVWWSQFSHMSLSIRMCASDRGKREVVLRSPTGPNDAFIESVAEIDSPGPVALKVTGTPSSYTFSYAASDCKWIDIGSVGSYVLTRTRPFDGIFTGTFFGIFSQGNSKPALVPADFSGIKMISL